VDRSTEYTPQLNISLDDSILKDSDNLQTPNGLSSTTQVLALNNGSGRRPSNGFVYQIEENKHAEENLDSSFVRGSSKRGSRPTEGVAKNKPTSDGTVQNSLSPHQPDESCNNVIVLVKQEEIKNNNIHSHTNHNDHSEHHGDSHAHADENDEDEGGGGHHHHNTRSIILILALSLHRIFEGIMYIHTLPFNLRIFIYTSANYFDCVHLPNNTTII